MIITNRTPLVTLAINARFIERTQFEGNLTAGLSTPERLTKLVAVEILRIINSRQETGTKLKLQRIYSIADSRASLTFVADISTAAEIELDDDVISSVREFPERLASLSKQLLGYAEAPQVAIGENIETTEYTLGVRSKFERMFCDYMISYGFENDVYKDFRISVLDSDDVVISLLPEPTNVSFEIDDDYETARISLPSKLSVRIGQETHQIDVSREMLGSIINEALKGEGFQIKLNRLVAKGYGRTYQRSAELIEFTVLQPALELDE